MSEKGGVLIDSKAIEILKSFPDGLRYTDLVRKTQEALPTQNLNYIRGQVYDLHRRYPEEVTKPSRGVFRHVSYGDVQTVHAEGKIVTEKPYEADLYQAFADYLKRVLEECTEALPVGHNKFGAKKWGTPDVVGVWRRRSHDIFPETQEIVSAEVKIAEDGRSLVEAFGQACSYKLFSHKSYLLVPADSAPEDLERVEALCLIFGIGLILFEVADPKNPEFQIRVRAIKHEPDPYYMNDVSKRDAVKDLFD